MTCLEFTSSEGNCPCTQLPFIAEYGKVQLSLLGFFSGIIAALLGHFGTSLRLDWMQHWKGKKRILVAGGVGFLGSHLCERLLNIGHEVLCVDNFFTGSKENTAHLLNRADFDLIRHDVTFPLSVEVDEIYNLACPASPIHYQHDPVRTIKTNIYGAINLLDLAKRLRIKIFQASTSEVYGDPDVHPQKEDYWGHVNPLGVRACYDEGKR